MRLQAVQLHGRHFIAVVVININQIDKGGASFNYFIYCWVASEFPHRDQLSLILTNSDAVEVERKHKMAGNGRKMGMRK